MSETNPYASSLQLKRPDVPALLSAGKLGRFRLIEHIGDGAMSSVLLAEDLTLKRLVALKVLPVGESRRQRLFLKQFVQEARSAASLVHHAIVQVFQAGLADDHAYIAMELIDGPNLRQVVEQDGPVEVRRACEWIADAAEGVAYAHEAGVIHRDIKPANLVLTARDKCKVCDFGVAMVMESDDGFTLPFNVVGTPYYLSPEAARGEATAGSDVWALAASLWYLLAGRPPFDVKSTADARLIHIEILLPDIRQLRPDVPEGLARVLERALSAAPSERFMDGDALAQAIRRFAPPPAGVPVARVVRPPEVRQAEVRRPEIRSAEERRGRKRGHARGSGVRSRGARGKGRGSRGRVMLLVGLVFLCVMVLVIAALVWRSGGEAVSVERGVAEQVRVEIEAEAQAEVMAEGGRGEEDEPEREKPGVEGEIVAQATTPREAVEVVEEEPAEVGRVGTVLQAMVEEQVRAPSEVVGEVEVEAEAQASGVRDVGVEGNGVVEAKHSEVVVETVDALDVGRLRAVLAEGGGEGAVVRVVGEVADIGPVRGDTVLMLVSPAGLRVRVSAEARASLESSRPLHLYRLKGRKIAVTGLLKPLAGRPGVPVMDVGADAVIEVDSAG